MTDPTPNCPTAGAVPEDAATKLVPLLTEALRALGDAGEPVTANRIAGRAWAALRRENHAAAQRINGLMHRLARRESAAAAPARR